MKVYACDCCGSTQRVSGVALTRKGLTARPESGEPLRIEMCESCLVAVQSKWVEMMKSRRAS